MMQIADIPIRKPFLVFIPISIGDCYIITANGLCTVRIPKGMHYTLC